MTQKLCTPQQSKIQKNKPNQPVNRQAWIQKTLHGIEQRIAEQAYNIRKQYLSQADSLPLQNANESVLDGLKMEQSRIRQRIREIKTLQKSLKTQRKQSYQFVVKSNSQLRKLTKKYRNFKQSLLEKSRLIQQQQQDQKIKSVKLKEEHMKTQCKQRRQKIQETLKQMQKNRKIRNENHQIQKQKLKQLKKQKLFQKMNQKWNQMQKQLNQQMKQNYQRNKKGFNVDMSTLSTHQQSYDTAKIEKQEKRTLRMAESRLMLPPIQIYRSKYFDNLVQYERNEKQRKQEKLEQKKNVQKKHKQFQQKIKSQYAPATKQQSESSQQDSPYALDREQTIQKGNQYLNQSKKFTIPPQKRQEHFKRKALQSLSQNETKSYHNYISEAFEKVDHTKKQKNKINPSLKKLKNIISNDSVSSFDKIEEVKGFVDHLAYAFESHKQSKQQQMMQKINAKIQLLEILN